MHIFFFDQYISLDMMAPTINELSKKSKVYICNFNKVQSLKKNKIYNFLIKKKSIIELSGIDENLTLKKINYYLLNLLLLSPAFVLKRGFKYWKYIWENYNFVSNFKVLEFIKKNNIKSISIDESLAVNKRKFLVNISNKLNIPIIMHHGGLYTIKSVKKNVSKFFDCNYYLSPNNFPMYTYNFKSTALIRDKYFQLGSPRYDIKWLNILDKIYLNKKKILSKKIKIGLFIRPTSKLNYLNYKLISEISKLGNIDLKINNKPRDIYPTKCSNINNRIDSSELIYWADLILSYPTSIIIEAICRDKPIIYLNFLQNNQGDKSWFDSSPGLTRGKSLNNTINLIKSFNLNNKNFKYRDYDKRKILKKFISYEFNKNIINNYNKFYNISHKY
tara:strand:+ start:29842 stop:31008 length:1167 start_codon:yes stop_codon:yes gene_type:complete